MRVKIRLSRHLNDGMRSDLSRPHPFAAERIGLLYVRLSEAGEGRWVILMTDYAPIADDRYIDDPSSGARIDSQAIRGAMQGVLDRQQGVFHVHRHEWSGIPRLSAMDSREIPRVVDGFRKVGPEFAHGIVLLSSDQYAAWVWLPGAEHPVQVEAVSIVGYPLEIFRGESR
jgi:hypothetical protein